jgi:glutathione S-transferase
VGVATIYHIPICPFSQRVEILLALKGLGDRIRFETVDVTVPRPDWLLAKTRGTTAMPILETEDGHIIKQSLVILRYVEDLFPDPPIARSDPWERAVENMLIACEGPFTDVGYEFLLNQDRARRDELEARALRCYADVSEFLEHHGGDGPFLFERFGLAEAVFTPFFVRHAFLEYYENFELPDEPAYARVRTWREACLAHPQTQQVGREEVIKLYYDYSKGAGNGGLLDGRARSSFCFEPDWRRRPWPPADKYGHAATDAELGLLDTHA